MIAVTSSISLDEKELLFDFIRSSGPGGQNVNKVSSGVQLRYNLNTTAALPEDVKSRLRVIARNRISEDGILIIEAKRHRGQEQNREDAVTRLVTLIRQATEKPALRRKTRPTAASQMERLEVKKRRAAVKRTRRISPREMDE